MDEFQPINLGPRGRVVDDQGRRTPGAALWPRAPDSRCGETPAATALARQSANSAHPLLWQRRGKPGVRRGRSLPSPDRSVQHCVGWLSRLRGGRQARPAQPRTLRLNAPRRPLRRAHAAWGSRLGLPSRTVLPHCPHSDSSRSGRAHEPRPLRAREHLAMEADKRNPLGLGLVQPKGSGACYASPSVDDRLARPRVERLPQRLHARNGD